MPKVMEQEEDHVGGYGAESCTMVERECVVEHRPYESWLALRRNQGWGALGGMGSACTRDL